MANTSGKFTTGSTMRHVAIMTLTGSLGLSFMFLVDAATLFWVGWLRDVKLVAATGFASTILFFTLSIGIGLMIAGSALISRALGARNRDEARRLVASAMVLSFLVQSALAILVLIFREPLLGWSGARGATLEVASAFLAITLFSLPFMAVGMMAAGVLRSQGDAWRSMLVTVVGGAVAMVLDPLIIIWMGYGVPGAAFVWVISRLSMAAVGLYFVIGVHDLAAKVDFRHLRRILPAFALIALPAVATQMSVPVGNFLLTKVMAQFGDGAVAGWSVILRLTVLAFGGIFALSGVVGGIIGQNYGAGMMDRVATAYRDSLVFCAIYTLAAWLILFACTGVIVRAFGLDAAGAEVVYAFTSFGAGAFVFTGALFVSNAAFNNLGRPVWSTGFNWLRDGIVLWPLAWLVSQYFGATGVVYAQGLAGVLIGTLAALTGWRYVRSLKGEVPVPVKNRQAEPI